MNSANKLPALKELILSWEKQHEETYTRQQKMLFKKKGGRKRRGRVWMWEVKI